MSAQNIAAFLKVIQACEGTDSVDGYRALFGYKPGNGKVFDSFAAHPNIASRYKQLDGSTIVTTAAGAFQMIYPTWKRLQAMLKLPDFSPDSQDAGAVQLITEVGALPYVQDGFIEGAINRCGTVWASMPSSNYPQPVRTLFFCENAFIAAGGSLG